MPLKFDFYYENHQTVESIGISVHRLLALSFADPPSFIRVVCELTVSKVQNKCVERERSR